MTSGFFDFVAVFLLLRRNCAISFFIWLGEVSAHKFERLSPYLKFLQSVQIPHILRLAVAVIHKCYRLKLGYY